MRYAIIACLLLFQSPPIRHKNVYIALHKQRWKHRAFGLQPTARKSIRRTIMIVSQIIARIRQYMRYRASVRALSALNERELSDIGLTRGDIIDVARQSAV
jgi:uncharacterized protein YjiS (DUF1127 family)